MWCGPLIRRLPYRLPATSTCTRRLLHYCTLFNAQSIENICKAAILHALRQVAAQLSLAKPLQSILHLELSTAQYSCRKLCYAAPCGLGMGQTGVALQDRQLCLLACMVAHVPRAG